MPAIPRGFAHFYGFHMGLIGLQARLQICNQRGFTRAIAAALWHGFAEFGAAKFGDAGDEIAQDIRQIFVHIRLEIVPGELAVGGFRCMAEKPPAPVIGRQDLKRLIHKDAAPLAGGELPTVIVEVVK